MPEIEVVSAGDELLAAWGESVADAINELYDEGFLPFAFAAGWDGVEASATSSNLVAVSASKAGIMLVPFLLSAPMVLQSVTLRSADSASARAAEAALYRDVGTTTLERITGTDMTWSFTPSAASDRTTAIGTPGTVLPRGTVWLAIRNTSASQTFGIRRIAAATEAAGNYAVQDNTPNANALGATLDVSALSPTGLSSPPCIRLNGRVYGGVVAF